MTQNPFPHKVELLAPAGSREALIGAFSAGADAVYLGGERFGARAYADNFSTEEIIRSIGQAHVLNKKVYLTANVLTREDELAELTAFVKELDEAGLDGVIVQDIGVLQALHEACPDLPLHASTQLSVTSSDAVRILRRLGVCRVVPARELSLGEIETLRSEDAAISSSPIEIEAFIHGAMCYSYSGRCLMSSFLGGRSGNRGRCAGTCRLPYRVLDENRKPVGPDARKKEVWPLSMKDMCVLPILPELIDAGIDSFKIEGRMKKPVYAAGVTAIYRKYIDRCYAWMEAGRLTPWKVEEEDLQRLMSLYIRTALGTGYYHAKNGRNLVTIGKPGYAGTDAALEEEIRRQYLGGLPARRISGRACFRTGEPASLTVTLCREEASGKTAVCTDEKEAAQRTTQSAAQAAGQVSAAEAGGQLSAQAAEQPAAQFFVQAPEQPAAQLSVQVSGALVQTASGSPLTREGLDARLRKTGDSLFSFSELEIEMDEQIFLPVSAVNALRREALARLQEEILKEALDRRHREALLRESARQSGQQSADTGEDAGSALVQSTEKSAGTERAETAESTGKPERAESAEAVPQTEPAERRPRPGKELWALVSTRRQMEAAASAGCGTILIDGDFDPPADKISMPRTQKGNNSGVKWVKSEHPERIVSGKIRYIRVLPPVFRVNNRDRIRQDLLSAPEKGYDGILVRTLEELSLVLQTGYRGEIIADASLYSWNGRSVSALAQDCGRFVCSLELNQNAILEAVRAADKEDPEALLDRIILPVYGRIPMMESAGCVRKTEKLCSKKDGFWYLEDRRGMHLPVRCRCASCSNTIYNAVPLSLHQFAGRGLYRRAPVHLCMFTTEDAQETRQILQYFGTLQETDGTGAKKRGAASGKAARPPFDQFTNGHYKTGAM